MYVSRFMIGFALLCTAPAVQGTPAHERQPSLAAQAAAMPADFRDHLFNAPLSARVMLDGKLLGDAVIVLKEDSRVKLVSYTDVSQSEWTQAEQQRWLDALAQPVTLGQCTSGCPQGLIAVDYNFANARLTLVTPGQAQEAEQQLWHALPATGSTGLIASHQLSLSAAQKQSTAMGLSGGLEAAFGNWSAISQYQVDRSHGHQAETRYAFTSLYLMRETPQMFYRAGLFSPDSQGILRQPYSRGSGISMLAGVMTGSSDTLLKEGNTPAMYPVWVTANREGTAEIWRNGVLINAQPVQPGLQALDTSPLPVGIYDVEVRILEDGRETSRSRETINKPAGWRDPGRRLRYNLFAGQPTTLGSASRQRQGDMAAGASLNYLILPHLTGGLALQKVDRETQAGLSMDWQAAQQVMMYGNLWHSSVTGYGYDTQATLTYGRGSVSLNHSRSWYTPDNTSLPVTGEPGTPARRRSAPAYTSQNTAMSASYRINGMHTINTRLTHRSGDKGIGIDTGFSTYLTVRGTALNLRADVFDRPYSRNGSNRNSTRNRGVGLTVSFSPGISGRSLSASLGSRLDAKGRHDGYVSATLSQAREDSFLRHQSLTVSADRDGIGVSSYNQFDAPLASGSFWGQRSSAGGLFSGGVNLGSTLVMTQGKATVSRDAPQHQGGGMIVDVASDDAGADLMAYHDEGATSLKPGRNFIPVQAWKPGMVRIDFSGKTAPALKALPQYLPYHHVRGGVSSHEVRVMKTLTVMGRLLDAQGRPAGGATVINHAGRTVTETDGMFTLELHEKNPVMRAEYPDGRQCDISISPRAKQPGELIFAGNLTCPDRAPRKPG